MLERKESGLLLPDHLGDAHQTAAFAKVINPLLSVEARGRMAGLVYNTWHGISYVKAHSGPNQPNSAAQLAARARLVTIGAEWRDLTQAQRDAWGVYADSHPETDWTGNPLRLTGQNWYMRCSIQLNRVGQTSVATPPAIAAPDPATGFLLSFPVADIEADWTTPTDGAHYLDIWMLGPVSTGVDPKIEHATGRVNIVATSAQPYTLVPAAASGRWRAWVKIIAIANGLTSTWMSHQIDVP